MYKNYRRDVIVILVGTAFIGFLIVGSNREYHPRPRVGGTMVYQYKNDKEKIAYRHYNNYTDNQSGYTSKVAYKSNYAKNSGHTTANVSTEKCDLKRRQFMPEGSMPVILLLSYPGSGNTWVRYLIERASGIYSGSVHHDAGTGVTEWEQFVKNGCRNWNKTYAEHIDALSKRLVVFYEDLVQDTSKELRRMLDFLHAPQNETRLQCLFRELDGPYKREHKRGLKQSPFNGEMNATVDGTIRDMRRIMEGYGITLPTYESTE